MPVSLTGSRVAFKLGRQLSVIAVLVFCALAYLFGPAAAPALRNAAANECNDYAQGNYRSFRLSWQVGLHPHWTCRDASRSADEPVSLGWWANPLR